MSAIGRKRLVPGLETRRASVCFDEKTYDRIKTRAAAKGLKISVFIRREMQKVMGKKKT